MNSFVPKIYSPLGSRSFYDRNSLAVFVRKHNYDENLLTVQSELRVFNSIDPSDCLFLVEGYKRYTSAENIFLDDFTDEKGIKSRDPIIPPFSASIAEAISMNKVVGALSVLVMDYFDFLSDKTQMVSDIKDIEQLFEQSVDAVSSLFEINTKVLRKEFDSLNWHDQSRLAEQLLKMKENRDSMIDKSNDISKRSLIETLLENHERFIFVMSGIEHEEVFVR